jgi:hypothetical protein
VDTKVQQWSPLTVKRFRFTLSTGSSETHSRNALAMSCCNASQAGVVMRHKLVTEIVVNLMLFKVDVLIHIPVPRLQDR